MSTAGAKMRTVDIARANPGLWRLAVFAGMSSVVVAVLVAPVLVQGMDGQISDTTRSYQVSNPLRQLALVLTDAERGQFGNLPMSDESVLTIYTGASAMVEAGMGSLIDVTMNDPSQLARVQQLSRDIVQRPVEPGRGTGSRAVEALAIGQSMGVQSENNLLSPNLSADGVRRWLVGAIVAVLAGAVALAYVLLVRAQSQVRLLAKNGELLQSENESMAAHLRDYTQVVEEGRAIAEREHQRVEALLQDTNHRIGNSLSTVSSLLGLQLLNSNSQEVRQALEAARSRVHAIASAHRRLRLGDDLETACTDEFLEAVLQDLANSVSESKLVSVVGEIDQVVISARDATTIGILVGELVTNALKHAFPDGREGHIIVRLKRDREGVPTLSVIDDGMGIGDQSELRPGGLGSVIVRQLAQQFGGTPAYECRAEGGLRVVVPLPRMERRPAVV